VLAPPAPPIPEQEESATLTAVDAPNVVEAASAPSLNQTTLEYVPASIAAPSGPVVETTLAEGDLDLSTLVNICAPNIPDHFEAVEPPAEQKQVYEELSPIANSNAEQLQVAPIEQAPVSPNSAKLLHGSGPQVLEEVNRLSASLASTSGYLPSLLAAKSTEVAALQAKLASLHAGLANQDETLNNLGMKLENSVHGMRQKRSDLEFQQLKLEERLSENFSLEETCMVLNARFSRLYQEVEHESLALQERPNTSPSTVPIQGPGGLARARRERPPRSVSAMQY